MENLIIEMLIPPEVKAGLKLGEQILNGGMILDSRNNSAMYVNESALEEILSEKLSPAALGIPQAAAAVTLAVAVGFFIHKFKTQQNSRTVAEHKIRFDGD